MGCFGFVWVLRQRRRVVRQTCLGCLYREHGVQIRHGEAVEVVDPGAVGGTVVAGARRGLGHDAAGIELRLFGIAHGGVALEGGVSRQEWCGVRLLNVDKQTREQP